jgi:hypothetical protein
VHGSSLQDFFFFFFFLFYEILFFFCIFNSVGLQEREKETSPFASLFRGLFVFIFISFFSLCASFKKTTNWNVGQVASIFFFFFFEKCFFFCLNFEFYPAVFPGTIRFELCPSHALVYSFISTHTHKFSASTCAQSKITREFIKCCYFIYFFKKFWKKKIK